MVFFAFLPAPHSILCQRQSRLSRRCCDKRDKRYSLASRPIRACASPSRTTDARGFVLPEEGDVVLYQGRWADEDAAGLVSAIRYIESRGAHVVDIVELKRVSSELFAVPGATARRGKRARWMDVADVRVVSDAKYVATQDAYRVTGTSDGYAAVVPLNEESKRIAAEEYRVLKEALMRDTITGGAVGTFATAIIGGPEVAGAFAAGAIGSAVYLAMLQRGVDVIGKEGPAGQLLGLRFLVPVVPFLGLAALSGGLGHGIEGLLGSVSKNDALAIVLGLLTYKVPLLARTVGEFVDGMADFEMGKTGMVGTTLGLAAREIKKRKSNVSDSIEENTAASDEENRIVFLFSGPSGVGKNTIIRMLTEEYPGRFSFSVSHTTRAKRDTEQDGVEYNFVDIATFEAMVKDEKFVEYARVHGQYYGTSYQAVDRVLQGGETCLLDLDVQGVESVRKKEGLDWEARFVWVAPPSIEALRERLKGRGTETEETLKTRLDTATREIAFAATNDVFDLIVVNDVVEDAYAELKEFINRTLPVTNTNDS